MLKLEYEQVREGVVSVHFSASGKSDRAGLDAMSEICDVRSRLQGTEGVYKITLLVSERKIPDTDEPLTITKQGFTALAGEEQEDG